MFKKTLLLLALAFGATPAFGQVEAEPVEVMVLGTFHFTGGGQDYINQNLDDFLAPQRQAEIDAVLDRLEAFAPDKIVVELEPEHEDWINERYRAWRAGEAELQVNERDQLGLKLAARLGHDRVYAVDYQNGMDFDAMMGAAQAAGQERLIAQFQSAIGEVQTLMAELTGSPVIEQLRVHNDPAFQANHGFYLTLAQMGTVENPVGAFNMADWWGRNMVIFARIAQIAEPGERVLVIYGSGHKYLLDQYVREAPGFEAVDPLAYLD
ncbi:hypothetical protein E5163_00675 [Marinicauda algicola]|uniref:TraB/GumN family protein n=1 Tax=Marinicauda algicola TaxID=2029849 RepID=A0A4V3RYA1_9PROT|nr:DUF5694 domain-containing protein [Marinicauda algicola]TGY89689.1 hypothetical protein E5163_00675 [Marinicauda algicola]